MIKLFHTFDCNFDVIVDIINIEHVETEDNYGKR